MIDEIIKQFAQKRAKEIDAEAWRMIADGCLFSDGWGLAIFDDPFNGRELKFTLMRVPPGILVIPLPPGVRSYQILRG